MGEVARADERETWQRQTHGTNAPGSAGGGQRTSTPGTTSGCVGLLLMRPTYLGELRDPGFAGIDHLFE
ncbi:hypothetical protein Acsp05_41310 [Actinokineospora sp. NBRC 105648]|nr:hypothetical protein Acsp05_41310 [Actinokineospora sp. NBRC 105648]